MTLNNLYLNETSIQNNKYFKTHKELLQLSKKEIEDIKAYKKRNHFLKNNNSKLGKGSYIYSFDLPAVVSCPDSSTCFKTCYANKSFFIFSTTKKSNTYNYALALNDIEYLQKELIKEIKFKGIRCIRIHSSGDFFSESYFLMWCNIAKKFPELKIFTYTKTPDIDLNLIPSNLNIINSFISYDNKKYLNYGSYDSMKKLAKNVKGLLCPITKGNHLKNDKLKALTCAVCKYCITKNKPTFIQH